MRAGMVPAILSAMLLAACGGPTAPRSDLAVTVSTADAALHLSNRGSFSIGFFPVEAGESALILWAPCGPDIPGCLILRPGADTSISYSTVSGYYAGAKEALVYWWRLVPGPADGLVPDSMRVVKVAF